MRRTFGIPPAPLALPPGPTANGTEEVAWADGMFFGRVPLQRWNPDELIGQRGYRVYTRMQQDDQLRALLGLKQSMVRAMGWHFRTERDDPAQRRCAAFFRFMLEGSLQGTFSDALGDMMTSQVYGFSLLEKVLGSVTWEGRRHWSLRSLKLRPAATFSFETDAHGNCLRLLQWQQGRQVPLPRERFVHHVNRPDVHPLYGESDLRACYRHWWAKDNLLKFWNIYLERMAAGFIHGRITGPLTASERDELKAVMQNISAQTSIITPASVELEMVTAPSTNAFEQAVAARDRAMAKALLVPNLLGFSEQGNVGSYSQSRTQFETFLCVINGLAESLADALNEQLFRELAWWNFGLRHAPRFAFDPLTAQQKRELATAWQAALGAGAVTPGGDDERRTRELLGYPQP